MGLVFSWGGLFYGLGFSEDYKKLCCEPIMFLLGIMLALVSVCWFFFFSLDDFTVHRGLGRNNSFSGLLFYS